MSGMRVAEPSSDEAQLRALIDAWAAAVRERNVDGIVARHAADVLLFDSVAPLQRRGVEAYRAAWADFFPPSWQAGLCDLSELRITAGAEVAFCSALMRCGGVEADGAAVALTLRLTMGFRKLHGSWAIVHEHCSEPIT